MCRNRKTLTCVRIHSRLRSQEEVKLKAELAQPLAELQDTARAIAEVQRECKLEVDPDEYVESFKPFLMDVLYAWSKVPTLAIHPSL